MKPAKKIRGLVSKRRKEKSKTLTYSIVLLTFFFFITSLPYSTVTAYFYIELINKPIGLFYLNCLAVLSFSYHSFNFIVFFLTNIKFWNECKLLFKIK